MIIIRKVFILDLVILLVVFKVRELTLWSPQVLVDEWLGEHHLVSINGPDCLIWEDFAADGDVSVRIVLVEQFTRVHGELLFALLFEFIKHLFNRVIVLLDWSHEELRQLIVYNEHSLGGKRLLDC